MAMIVIAASKERVLVSSPVAPDLLASANWWFTLSWYGLLFAGVATALSAIATGVFLCLQFWSTDVKERHAEWRTSTLELQTAQAKLDTANAGVKIAELGVSVAEANARAAEATQKAREAEFALEKLRRNQMPRMLNPEQRSKIVVAMRRYSGQKFMAISLMGDSEGYDFLNEIARALVDAGWDHNGPAGIIRAVMTGKMDGLAVALIASDIDSGHIPAAVAGLLSVLVDAGLTKEAVLTRNTDTHTAIPAGMIGILVGSKPIEK